MANNIINYFKSFYTDLKKLFTPLSKNPKDYFSFAKKYWIIIVAVLLIASVTQKNKTENSPENNERFNGLIGQYICDKNGIMNGDQMSYLGTLTIHKIGEDYVYSYNSSTNDYASGNNFKDSESGKLVLTGHSQYSEDAIYFDCIPPTGKQKATIEFQYVSEEQRRLTPEYHTRIFWKWIGGEDLEFTKQ